MDISSIFCLALLSLAGIGLIWRLCSPKTHEAFKNEAPGAFLAWLLRRLK